VSDGAREAEVEFTPATWAGGATPDAELARRAKRRDPQAWTEIYERNQHLIYRYARARVSDHEVAEDLASAVFVAAVKGIDSYRHTGKPLLAWLYGIARNVVSQHQRRDARERRHRVSLRADGSGGAEEYVHHRYAAVHPGENGVVAPGVDWTDLKDAIARISDEQREVIILRHFVGLTTDEIAGTLGKKPAAVYSLESRALIALRRQLAG
jgi:RNA polymerase sigma-70 factor (ECF subfamily)